MQQLLKFKKYGVHASLQDKGRFGYRKFGVPTSGPMDYLAYYWGNRILGNDESALSLELFVGGFEFEALERQQYVITGANGNFFVNGSTVEPWKTFELKEGDLLSIQFMTEGQIAYLSVVGGFKESGILGSHSFYAPAKFGRKLANNECLFGIAQDHHEKERVKGLYSAYIPAIKKKQIRVYKGPHCHLFNDESVEQFINGRYKFTGGNRMGYYFSGPQLSIHVEKDILSEGTQFGTIQVPSSGQPIILMADSQTVGGYPVIGTVLQEDLRYISQLNMYEEIQFVFVEMEWN